jgi:dCMP deaminase
MSSKWHSRFIHLAKEVSLWSKDPNTKVGAIIVGAKGQILAQGYNGFPRKIRDTPKRLNDRELKYKYVVHAEMNAVFNASYSGTSLDGATIYVYGLPICHECAKGIIQVGIKKVVIEKQRIGFKEHWKESCDLAVNMLQEAGVTVYEV